MDVGGATHWSLTRVLPRSEMLARLEAHYGPITPVFETSSAPADRYTLADGTVFGIISSTTEPFCHSCDRSRLTADGSGTCASMHHTARTCGVRCAVVSPTSNSRS
jgi:cyclic pyranopterin phosphate synthase